MLKKTSFAVSSDESRYVLNGIFISLKDHKMTMVATDGRRLALVTRKWTSRKRAAANHRAGESGERIEPLAHR